MVTKSRIGIAALLLVLSVQVSETRHLVKRGAYTQGFDEWFNAQYNEGGEVNEGGREGKNDNFSNQNSILVSNPKRHGRSSSSAINTSERVSSNNIEKTDQRNYERSSSRIAGSLSLGSGVHQSNPGANPKNGLDFQRSSDPNPLPFGSVSYQTSPVATPETDLDFNRNSGPNPLPLGSVMHQSNPGATPRNGLDFNRNMYKSADGLQPETESSLKASNSVLFSDHNGREFSDTPQEMDFINTDNTLNYPDTDVQANQQPSTDNIESIKKIDLPAPDEHSSAKSTTGASETHPVASEEVEKSNIEGYSDATDYEDESSQPTDNFDYEVHYPDIEITDTSDETADSLESPSLSDLSLLGADKTSGTSGLDITPIVKRDEYTGDVDNLYSKLEFNYNENEFNKKYGSSSPVHDAGNKVDGIKTTGKSTRMSSQHYGIQFRTDDNEPFQGAAMDYNKKNSSAKNEDATPKASYHLVKRNKHTGDFGDIFPSRQSNKGSPRVNTPTEYPKREFKYDDEEFNKKYGSSSFVDLKDDIKTPGDAENAYVSTETPKQTAGIQFRTIDNDLPKEITLNSSESKANISVEEDPATNSSENFRSYNSENSGIPPLIPHGAPITPETVVYSGPPQEALPPTSRLPPYPPGGPPPPASAPYNPRPSPPRTNMHGQPLQDYSKPFDEFYLTEPQYKSLYPRLLNSGLNFQIFPEQFSNSQGRSNFNQNPRGFGGFGGPFGGFGGSFGGFGGLENDTVEELNDLENIFDDMSTDITEPNKGSDASMNPDFEANDIMSLPPPEERPLPFPEERRPPAQEPPLVIDNTLQIGNSERTQDNPTDEQGSDFGQKPSSNPVETPSDFSSINGMTLESSSENQNNMEQSDANKEIQVGVSKEAMTPSIGLQNGPIEGTDVRGPMAAGVRTSQVGTPQLPSVTDESNLPLPASNVQNEFIPEARIQNQPSEPSYQDGNMKPGGDRPNSLPGIDIQNTQLTGSQQGPNQPDVRQQFSQKPPGSGQGFNQQPPRSNPSSIPGTNQQPSSSSQQNAPNQQQNQGSGSNAQNLPPQLQNMGNTFGSSFWNSFSKNMGGITMGMPGMSQLLSMTQQAANQKSRGGNQGPPNRQRPQEPPLGRRLPQRPPLGRRPSQGPPLGTRPLQGPPFGTRFPQGPQGVPPRGILPQRNPTFGRSPQRHYYQNLPSQNYLLKATPYQRYPTQNYNYVKYPPQNYISGRYPSQNYYQSTYPSPRYGPTQYPPQRYNVLRNPPQNYYQSRYPSPKYGSTQYPPQRYNDLRNPPQNYYRSGYPSRVYNPTRYPPQRYNVLRYPLQNYYRPRYPSRVYNPTRYRPQRYNILRYPPQNYYRPSQEYSPTQYPSQRYNVLRYPPYNYSPRQGQIRLRAYPNRMYPSQRTSQIIYFPRRMPPPGYPYQRYIQRGGYYPRNQATTNYGPGARYRTSFLARSGTPSQQQYMSFQQNQGRFGQNPNRNPYSSQQGFLVKTFAAPGDNIAKPYKPFCSDCKNVSSMVKKLGELNYVPTQDNHSHEDTIEYRSLQTSYFDEDQDESDSGHKNGSVLKSSSVDHGVIFSTDSATSSQVDLQTETESKLAKRQVLSSSYNSPSARYPPASFEMATPVRYEPSGSYPVFKSSGRIMPQPVNINRPTYNAYNDLYNPNLPNFRDEGLISRFRSTDSEPEETPLLKEAVPQEESVEVPVSTDESPAPPPTEEGETPDKDQTDPDYKSRNPYNYNYSKSVSVTKKLSYGGPLENDENPYNGNNYAPFRRNNNNQMFSYFPNFQTSRNRNTFFRYPNYP